MSSSVQGAKGTNPTELKVRLPIFKIELGSTEEAMVRRGPQSGQVLISTGTFWHCKLMECDISVGADIIRASGSSCARLTANSVTKIVIRY